ncbi:MAG: hypothetical protein AAF420_00380 [Pseudomonadota bacterium]
MGDTKGLRTVAITLESLEENQKLVVVALRHLAYLGESLAAVSLDNKLASKPKHALMRSSNTLIRVLLSNSKVGNVLNSPGSHYLSEAEHDLLDAIALVQQGASIRMVLHQLSWLTLEGTGQTSCALMMLAEDLKQHDLILPLMEPRDRGAQPPTPQRLPQVTKLDLLTDLEKILVVAVRLCVVTIQQKVPTMPVLVDYFVPIDLGELAPCFNVAMRSIARHAVRPFDAHCVGCQHLSMDEARVLAAIHCAQEGDGDGLKVLAGEWLDERQRDIFCACIYNIGRSLVRTQWTISPRDWHFDSSPDEDARVISLVAPVTGSSQPVIH